MSLAGALLELPHAKLPGLAFVTPAEGRLTIADFTKLNTRFPYIVLIPQARFLEFLVERARAYIYRWAENRDCASMTASIDLSTRRAEIAGIAKVPRGLWMSQIARSLTGTSSGYLAAKPKQYTFESWSTAKTFPLEIPRPLKWTQEVMAAPLLYSSLPVQASSALMTAG